MDTVHDLFLQYLDAKIQADDKASVAQAAILAELRRRRLNETAIKNLISRGKEPNDEAHGRR